MTASLWVTATLLASCAAPGDAPSRGRDRSDGPASTPPTEATDHHPDLHAYRVKAPPVSPLGIDGLPDPEPEVDPVDDSVVLFDEEVLPEFEIELDEVAMDSLRADPYRWVEGALLYDGARYEPVGVRLKGQNSFEPIDEKPSLKIDLNRYADLELLGLKGLTLDNMDNDPSMVHERLAYRMYRELGVPAARCTHAHVTLNGRDLGLYAHVETVDKTMIGRWLDDHGSMFEVADVDFRPGFSPYDFEVEFGPGGTTNLQGVFDALAQPDPDQALADVEAFMSVDAFVGYFAASMVVGQFDGYPYSDPGDDAHLYDDPTSGVLVWLPHGVDETFHRTSDPFSGVDGLLGTTCLASTSCRDQLEAAVLDALDVMDAIDLPGYARDVIAQVDALGDADTNKPYTDAEVDAERDTLLDFVDGRRAFLEDLL